jgi:hypothetical protein
MSVQILETNEVLVVQRVHVNALKLAWIKPGAITSHAEWRSGRYLTCKLSVIYLVWCLSFSDNRKALLMQLADSQKGSGSWALP